MSLILVVDDEHDVRVYLTRLLEEHGHAVVCAADGNEAAEQVRRRRPDLITLDLSMPAKSGVKFYRELKADPALAAIPVVFVTAVAGFGRDPRDAERFYATRHGVPPPEGFLAKPVDPDETVRLIERLIAAAAARQS